MSVIERGSMAKKSRPTLKGGGPSARNGSAPGSKSLDRLAQEVFEQLQDIRPTRTALQELLKRQGLALADATRMSEEEREAVAATLDRLPTEQRKMLMWHWNGMTTSEIAERQAKTTEDVARELAMALAQLRSARDESAG
jgi:RNA polymerase sigma factor (sigma-70 family)